MTDSQLRIAMLSVHSCPIGNLGAKDTGGMSVYIRELSHELGKQGHQVDIYTRIHDPKDRQVYDIGCNARLIHLDAGGDREINKSAIYPYLPDFTRNLEIFKQQNNLQYDLLFSHYWLSGCVGELLKNSWNVPHITMFHTIGAVKNSIGIGEGEPELRVETEKQLANNCNRIITATVKEKANLIKHYHAIPERIIVVPCGVNLDLFHPVDKKLARRNLGLTDNNILLYVGRIEPLKGLEQLLKAMPLLQNEHKLRLLIIGGDENSQDEIEKLQELSHKLKIQDFVTFMGIVQQEKLPCYYSAADVSVIPSYYESFGLVALESLACGTPVVATDVGEMNNIIQDGKTGYVVPDNNPQYLADKIAFLFSNSKSEKEAILYNRASITGYSWYNIAEVIAKKCQQLLSEYHIKVL
ncbi:glycosyltransferase [Chloroflexota bacterium]